MGRPRPRILSTFISDIPVVSSVPDIICAESGSDTASDLIPLRRRCDQGTLQLPGAQRDRDTPSPSSPEHWYTCFRTRAVLQSRGDTGSGVTIYGGIGGMVTSPEWHGHLTFAVRHVRFTVGIGSLDVVFARHGRGNHCGSRFSADPDSPPIALMLRRSLTLMAFRIAPRGNGSPPNVQMQLASWNGGGGQEKGRFPYDTSGKPAFFVTFPVSVAIRARIRWQEFHGGKPAALFRPRPVYCMTAVSDRALAYRRPISSTASSWYTRRRACSESSQLP